MIKHSLHITQQHSYPVIILQISRVLEELKQFHGVPCFFNDKLQCVIWRCSLVDTHSGMRCDLFSYWCTFYFFLNFIICKNSSFFFIRVPVPHHLMVFLPSWFSAKLSDPCANEWVLFNEDAAFTKTLNI